MTDLYAGVPRKSKEMLEAMVKDRIVTKEGIEWLIAATDPFHDHKLTVNGYPDVASTDSVTQSVSVSTNVSVATGVDLHVFMAPFSQMWSVANQLSPYNIRDNGANGGTNSSGAVMNSGMNIITVNTGQDWRTHSSASQTNSELTLPLAYSYGQFRLIACGWEIVNVSPAINKGGSVTCYRVPNALVNSYILRDYEITTPLKGEAGTAHVYTTHNCELGTLPPGTQAQAVLYPSSRTWNAQDGVYQVAVLNTVENSYTSTLPGFAGFCEIPSQAQLTSDSDRVAFLPQTIYATNSTVAFANNSHLLPYDVSGSVFRNGTGYTQNYQITVKYIVEKIPTDTDPVLLVMTRPPAPYDPVILEIYSRVMAKMPVGVPVGENPLGEWFNDVMDGVAQVLPVIGKALTPFFAPAGLIGDALGAGAKTLANNNRAASAAELQRRMAQSEKDKASAATKVIQTPPSITLPPSTNRRQ